MPFTKEEFISNLYEVSRSQKDGKAVLSPREQDKPVYNLDKAKDWFSDQYRNQVKLRSCDGFYRDDWNALVLEFKNTHHLKFKEFMGEIEQKLADTHMLLLETFYDSGKVKKIAGSVSALIIYNDSLPIEPGVLTISEALNGMKPLRGASNRKSKAPILYTEEEFEQETGKVIEKYQGQFFKEVEFMEKKEFCEKYGSQGYFRELT